MRSWKNSWGLFSKKTVGDIETFSFIEWIVTAIFGFIVLYSVNKFIMKRFFKKLDKEEEEANE